jgi:hypothetical protein
MTMRKTIGLTAVISMLLSSAAILAQEAPKPGPEHKKLDYFAGKWTSEGQMKANPFGMPTGEFSSRDDCQWWDGGFSLVCNSVGKSPMGPTKGLGIMSYNAEEKVYTYYGVDNGPMAMSTVPRGTVNGDTWTYSDESMMGGKKVKSRYVIKQLTPTSYTFKWEIAGEGGAWTTIVEGTTKRAA